MFDKIPSADAVMMKVMNSSTVLHWPNKLTYATIIILTS
jgi:hypothetical protein